MKYYKVREVAQICGVKVRTVREWIKLGKIKTERDTNQWYYLIPEAEVEKMRHRRENKD